MQGKPFLLLLGDYRYVSAQAGQRGAAAGAGHAQLALGLAGDARTAPLSTMVELLAEASGR